MQIYDDHCERPNFAPLKSLLKLARAILVIANDKYSCQNLGSFWSEPLSVEISNNEFEKSSDTALFLWFAFN